MRFVLWAPFHAGLLASCRTLSTGVSGCRSFAYWLVHRCRFGLQRDLDCRPWHRGQVSCLASSKTHTGSLRARNQLILWYASVPPRLTQVHITKIESRSPEPSCTVAVWPARMSRAYPRAWIGSETRSGVLGMTRGGYGIGLLWNGGAGLSRARAHI